jgi:hypothetical protein
LASAGEFILANKLGIWWHTETPFDSEFILSGGGMVQRSAGVEAANVSGDQQPELRLASSIFFALFTLDIEALSHTFDLYGVSDHNRWQLGLRPKSAAMATLFKDALISGGANVERVLLYESNGDTTEINLRDLRSEQTELKPAERERLGFSK